MFAFVGGYVPRRLVKSAALMGLVTALFGGSAAAQTVVLNQPGTQVTDTMIRNGLYANTNYDGDALITRASSNDIDWERRSLLKFDTKNTIPANTRIASATLTLTVKSGLGSSGQTRRVQTYRISTPFQESDATWWIRQYSERWGSGGGDTAETGGGANVTNAAGAKVNFDVTEIVQNSINGRYDSRYTRIGLVDVAGDAKESYREYYSSEDSSASRRPTLTVVFEGATAPPVTGGSTSMSHLKVMTWNIEQGRNIDGQVSWIAKINPDVISFNEMMSGHLATYASKLKAATGKTWNYKFEQIGGLASGIGVAVFTHLPIDGEAAFLMSYTRSAQDIRVIVNSKVINVTSTHLDHQSSSYRLTQVKQLKGWLTGVQESRIVAGDFNWYPGTTEINEMGKDYYDSWAVAKSAGTSVSSASNPNGNTRNNRIDYVWYSKGASHLSVAACQVYETGSVSDHRPVMTTFRVN